MSQDSKINSMHNFFFQLCDITNFHTWCIGPSPSEPSLFTVAFLKIPHSHRTKYEDAFVLIGRRTERTAVSATITKINNFTVITLIPWRFHGSWNICLLISQINHSLFVWSFTSIRKSDKWNSNNAIYYWPGDWDQNTRNSFGFSLAFTDNKIIFIMFWLHFKVK